MAQRVERTATGRTAIRDAVWWWDAFASDPALRFRDYYKMKRAWYAGLLVLLLSGMGDWRQAAAELQNAARRGDLSLRVVVDHIRYKLRFMRMGVARKLP